MNELKIGDRVRVISVPDLDEVCGTKIRPGMTGTVKEIIKGCIGIEFDEYMGGHDGNSWLWSGKKGYCWNVTCERLEKIEETDTEETKAEMLEQKILEVLREEIGVRIGEEFEAYENGEKQWTCKFEESGFFCEIDDEFYKSEIWKNIAYNFCRYTFKRKPLFPTKERPYFYVQMRLDNNGNAIYDGVDYTYWYGKDFDIAMLITGNYFKTEEEAEDNKEKVIEKMNSLLRAEYE